MEQVARNGRRGIGRDLLNSGILVFGSSMILNIAGFVFYAVASRRLGVAQYGALYSLISLYSLAAMPALVFSPVIAKFAAEFRALHDDGHVRGLAELIGRAFGMLGVAYLAASLILARPLSSFMHVALWSIPIVGLLAAIGLLAGAARSLAQGMHHFVGYAGSTAAEGIGKIAALVVLGFTGLTLFKSVTVFFLGLASGALLMIFPVVARLRRVEAVPVALDGRRILQATWGAASLAVTTSIIGFADVVLVKHFFTPHETGLYSAASLGGKILLYFVGFIPAVLIPHATDRFSRGQRTRETIWAALGFILVASIAGIVGYHIFGIYLLHALVGREFDGALPLLAGYGAAMALLAATNVLGSYGIATHRLSFAAPLLISAVATLAWIALRHASLEVVVRELIIGNIAMLTVVAVALTWQGYRTRSDR